MKHFVTRAKLFKQAQAVSALPHQQRVIDRISNQRPGDKGLLVVHGLGSGKTLTSLLAGKALNRPTHVLAPAATATHFVGEGGRIPGMPKVTAESHERAMKRNTDARGVMRDLSTSSEHADKLLVYDEAHRMVGPSHNSKKQELLKLPAAKKLLLTATPMRNSPADIAPLINAVRPGALPTDPASFSKQYVRNKKVKPGLLGWLKGVRPGEIPEIHNAEKFRSKIQGVVDYHATDKEHFPSATYEDVKVDLSPRQSQILRSITSKNPILQYKLHHNLPPDKKEVRNMMAFYQVPRIVSNSAKGYSIHATDDDSAKLNAAANRLVEKSKTTPNFKAVAYSNYLDGGVREYSSKLQKHNIPHTVYHGGLSKRQRDQAKRDYNEGKIKALLISGAGAEGLDLKGTKLMQVLEPHWNSARTDQVIGRAIRYKSHAALPPEERKVHVERYYGVASRPTMFGLRKKKYSVDEYIHNVAQRKTNLIKQFEDQIRSASGS